MDVNHFDRLSDDLLRVIFNRVVDANSLGCCLCVSKRFASVVSQTKAITLLIPRRTVVQPSHRSPSIIKSRNFRKILMRKLITKPLRFLHRTIVCNSSTTKTTTTTESSNNSEDENICFSVYEVLMSFKEIESLKLTLPSHRLEEGLYGSDGVVRDQLIKWKAEFGSRLRSCVILYAKSLKKARPFSYVKFNNYYIVVRYENGENQDPEESMVEQDEVESKLTLTILYTLTATARHRSLAPIIPSQRMLRKLEVTDDKERGKVCMNEEQIAEMRKSRVTTSLPERLSVEIRYVPVLELPETGMVMEGATLAVVKAVDTDSRVNDDGDWLERVFDGDKEEEALNEAVREMMKTEATFTHIFQERGMTEVWRP